MPTWAWVLIGLASGLVTLYILAVLTAFMVGVRAAKEIVKSQESMDYLKRWNDAWEDR